MPTTTRTPRATLVVLPDCRVITLYAAAPRALPPARHDPDPPDVPGPPAPVILAHHRPRPRSERHAWHRFLRHLVRAL